MKRAHMVGRAMRKLAVVGVMVIGGSFVFGGCTLTTVRDQIVSGGLAAINATAKEAVGALIPTFAEFFPRIPNTSPLFDSWGL
ncbi:MAG TPA: hypothetical protein PKY77_13095 [Phycisphaerae bacterium]|nr:hypothetical protein [Phycisphaerae bacterium]HRY68288.1 hypothetical protein [Phycisphaerae bacterium]HSA26829.1 hypothetical protein [Phycisphaerae bacterium]